MICFVLICSNSAGNKVTEVGKVQLAKFIMHADISRPIIEIYLDGWDSVVKPLGLPSHLQYDKDILAHLWSERARRRVRCFRYWCLEQFGEEGEEDKQKDEVNNLMWQTLNIRWYRRMIIVMAGSAEHMPDEDDSDDFW